MPDVEKVDWDITFTFFSHHGRYPVTGVTRDGRATISVVENATGKAVELPAIPNGGIGGVAIARSEARLAFYVNGDRSPNDLGKTFFAADDRKHGREPLWGIVSMPRSIWPRCPTSIPAGSASWVAWQLRRLHGAGGAGVSARRVRRRGGHLRRVETGCAPLGAMPVWWEAQRKAFYAELGDPVADEKMLYEVSPVFTPPGSASR